MEDKVDQSKYVWVITERFKTSENFLGLTDDAGQQFVPVTAQKDDALILLGRLPDSPEAIRTVEAMHKEQIAAQANEEGFAVYLVDARGRILAHIGGGSGH